MTRARAAALPPFDTVRVLRHGDVMTVYAWARPRSFPALPPAERRLFRVAPDTQVLAECYWQPDRSTRPLLLALHGLESSSEAHYMRGLADQAVARGWNAVLLNQRNCGGTEHLTPGLYHSGLTADPMAVIRELTTVDGIDRIGVVGYSLGGNLAVKLAGEIGGLPDPPVRAVAAVSPPIDLAASVCAIERPRNSLYHWNFVRSLRDRMRRKALAWPGAFDLRPLADIRTIRQFDDAYTAPYHGFASASDYYAKASALRILDRVRIPTLILSAADDPFIPSSMFESDVVRQNAEVAVRVERCGGHCGFIGSGDGPRRYWAESTAVAFLADVIAG